MELTFYKYHGAGNDFILFDDFATGLHERFDPATIARLCDRRFGIGGDGMMFLRPHSEFDFEMVYYNSDGAPSSMCGNGGRCLVRFAADRGYIGNECSFLAVDGPHQAALLPKGWVSLQMSDTKPMVAAEVPDASFVDTGSPHVVQTGYDPTVVDVNVEGRRLRNTPAYRAAGVNINFVKRTADGSISIATYERGVEAETLACGTGVTAAALAAATEDALSVGDSFSYAVRAKGGDLRVRGTVAEAGFCDIWLEGPTAFVFSGVIAV